MTFCTFCRRPHATQPEHRASDPLIGYLNYSDINQCRRTTPNDWAHDPYLVVLLSVAQLQQRLLNPLKQTDYTSRLLVTNASDGEFIHLYEAQISSEVLRMLDSPTTAKSVRWPTIQRRRIPFKLFDTFKYRLEGALLELNNLQNYDSLQLMIMETQSSQRA
ncbi:uncharacterized protein BDV17DRAFT_25674 [Aspergillus undulatus]|uniref:uncharacterized protein n=1 Tax=Aspergillus undulatus TaxID=1810928 RepID=UPI003CCD26FB